MTLDELRELFRCEPEAFDKTKVDVRKMREKRARSWPGTANAPKTYETVSRPDGASVGRVTLSASGDDGIIQFGKHKGSSLRELLTEDPAYLRWMSAHTTCPDALHAVIEALLKEI